MITDSETIELVLSKADNIFYWDIGDERIMLVYDNGALVKNNPFGGLVHKPILDVGEIVFHSDPGAWRVIWKA